LVLCGCILSLTPQVLQPIKISLAIAEGIAKGQSVTKQGMTLFLLSFHAGF
jgi:hypothetical protein